MRFPTFLVAAAIALSCGPNHSRVKQSPCSGCVDSEGLCLVGNEARACGLQGVACVQCANDQQCVEGGCVSLNVGGGSGGGTGAGGGFSVLADGGVDDCSEEAKLIYLVDQDRTLSSFNPRAVGQPNGPFVDLGQITCASQPGAEPFSMAVDRNATAWIIYDSGELFTVDVKTTPLTCVKTAFAPHRGVAKFGMGFVANSPGSHEETLFVSGSDLGSSLSTTRFGTLSTTPSFELSLTGVLTGAPELTGNGNAELWAFFPNVMPPKVARLSKSTGAIETDFQVQGLAGDPRAWAFAFWGGDFFVFLERATDGSTRVWKVNGMTGALSPVLGDTGRTIVGAGVSTCAPVEIN